MQEYSVISQMCEQLGEQQSEKIPDYPALNSVYAAAIEHVFCLSVEWGSTKTGEQEDLITTALNCVLKVPQYLPQEQRFDIRVLVSAYFYFICSFCKHHL